MKKTLLRMLSFFLVLVSLLAVSGKASAPLQMPAEDAMSSSSAESHLLMDGNTGEILLESNARKRLPIASVTKVMTCLLALEEGDLSSVVFVPREAVGAEGSSIYLIEGERFLLSDLVYGLMLESANDAALAIALHLSESVEEFAEKMNRKAAELGMDQTHFVNPHGLQHEMHYSTARDVAVLMRAALALPAFREISGTLTKTVSSLDGKSRYLSNHNKLLRSLSSCVAGKTGYTKTAGRCLASAAEKNGKLLVCVTLNDPNDWRDHVAFFEYGFGLYESRFFVEAGGILKNLPVVGGEEKEVTVTNSEGLNLMLKSTDRTEMVFEMPRFLYASVAEGVRVGEAVVLVNGIEAARLELKTTKPVPYRTEKISLWQRIIRMIEKWLK